jgi:hypothetical protein
MLVFVAQLVRALGWFPPPPEPFLNAYQKISLIQMYDLKVHFLGHPKGKFQS